LIQEQQKYTIIYHNSTLHHNQTPKLHCSSFLLKRYIVVGYYDLAADVW